MVPIGEETSSDLTLDPALSEGNLMGKRYVDENGAEVLVTKAGKGTLSVGTTALTIKEAKPLPASANCPATLRILSRSVREARQPISLPIMIPREAHDPPPNGAVQLSPPSTLTAAAGTPSPAATN